MKRVINELTGPFKRTADVQRLPAHPVLGKTAVTGYSGVANVVGPEISGLTTKRLLQFKDPIYPLWFEYNTSAIPAIGVAVNYQTDLIAPAGNPVNPYNAQIEDIYSVATANVAATADALGVAGVTSNWTTLSQTWPMMLDEKLGGAPFVYVPSNFCLSVATWMSTTYAGGGSASGTMMLEFWTAPGESDTQVVSFNDQSATVPGAAKRGVTSSAAVWVRPRATTLVLAGAGTVGAAANIYSALYICPGTPGLAFTNTGVAPTFTSSINAGSTYSLMPVPETMPQSHLTGATLSFDNLMMHSSHLQIENMTKVLNKEGVFDCAKLNMAVVNPWISSSANFTSVDPAKRYTRAAEHGLTAYVDPTPEYDRPRNHRIFYNYKDNALANPLVVMQLRNSDCFNLILLTDSDVATAGTFIFRFSGAWEFLTTSTLYETTVVDLKRYPLTLVDAAMNVLAMRCPFRRFEGDRQELRLEGGVRPRQRRPPQRNSAKTTTKPKPSSTPRRPQPMNPAAPKTGAGTTRGYGGRGRPAGYPR